MISECSKLAQKENKTRHDWVGKVIHWEMCKKFNFDHTNKLYSTTQHLSWKITHMNSYGTLTYKQITESRPKDQTYNNNNNQQKKKRNCKIVDFDVPAEHRIKLKKCEKKDKYLDLARESKKLWNVQVTIIPIVIGAFGTVTKGLLKWLKDLEVSGRVETIQTTALLRTVRMLRKVLETWEDLLSLKLQRKHII